MTGETFGRDHAGQKRAPNLGGGNQGRVRNARGAPKREGH